MDFILKSLNPTHLRHSLLLVTPNETSFETMAEVPNYLDLTLFWFLLLTILEFIFSDDDKVSFNDSITNLHASFLNLLFKFGGRSLAAVFYEDLYNYFCIVKLPWDSPWTWVICLLTTDFAYYLSHRAQHEIGIFWAFHQVHHSSEYFNLSISMRHGAIQDICAAIFELMQCFFIPPGIYLAHRYMCFLRMFWLHASFIPHLGPLEYILVTPRTHAVHHARNHFGIDTNYGGTFLIWDILFGTYAPPREDEKIAYGLVEPIRSFDQLWLQFFEFKVFGWDKGHMKNANGDDLFPGFWNKVKTVFMPPGYFPGVKTQWFFFWKHNEDPTEGIPPVEEPVEIYNPPLTRPMKTYLLLNSAFLVYGIFLFNSTRLTMPWFNFVLSITFLLVRVQMFGYYMDHRWFASLYDVFTMFLSIQIATWLNWPALALYCKLCIGGALLLAWCGYTPTKLKTA